MRAVLEGVAFGLRDSLELVDCARWPGSLGPCLGRWRPWALAPIVASVLGLPIELTETEEGSAYGAALLGGVAAGMFETSRMPSAVRSRPRHDRA